MANDTITRIFALVAMACSLLGFGLCFQSCIENPGTDTRLNQPDTAFQHVGSARLHGEKVLDYAARIDGNYLRFRVKNVSGRILSSTKVLVQVLPLAPKADTSVFVSDAQLEFMEDFREIRPGGTVLASRYEGEFGKAFASGVQDFGFFITLLELNDGSVRHHPMSGIYGGNYFAQDSARYRSSGTAKGFIDADGRIGFRLEESAARGVNGYLSGLVGDSGRVAAGFKTHDYGISTTQLFGVAQVLTDTLGNLDASFVKEGADAAPLDSLSLRMLKRRHLDG